MSITTNQRHLSISLRVIPWFKTLNNIHGLLQLMNFMIWITPFTNLFLTSKDQIEIAQIFLCVFVGLYDLPMLRSFIQGYLNGSLFTWYDAIQADRDGFEQVHSKRVAALKVTKISYLVCKATIQLIILPILYLSCGIMLWIAYDWHEVYLYSIVGFLSWWTSCVWLTYNIGIFVSFVLGISDL